MFPHAEWVVVILILVLSLSTMITTAIAASLLHSASLCRGGDPGVENAYRWSWATAVVNGLLVIVALVALGVLIYNHYHK